MLESNLYEGSQKFTGDHSALKYGVSISDECIFWEAAKRVIQWAGKKLDKLLNLRIYCFPEFLTFRDFQINSKGISLRNPLINLKGS